MAKDRRDLSAFAQRFYNGFDPRERAPDDTPNVPFTRRVARGLAISDRRVLVVKARGRHNYFLPGGGIQRHESSADALIREFREEIGVVPTIDAYLGSWANFYQRNKLMHQEINELFRVSLPPDTKCLVSLEPKLVVTWLPMDELEYLRLYPPFIEWFLAQSRNTASLSIIRTLN